MPWTRLDSDTVWSLHGIWGVGRDDVYAVGEHGTVLHRFCRSSVWRPQATGSDLRLLSIWGPDARTLYATGGICGGLLRSTDGGVHWTRSSLLPTGRDRFTQVHGANGRVFLVGKRGRIARSDDAGESWTIGSSAQAHVEAIWAGASSAFFVGSDSIYRSVDRGASWHLVHRGSLVLHAVWSDGDGRVFAAGRTQLVASDDDGDSWRESSFSAARGHIAALFGTSDGALHAAGANGLLARSTDDGRTWEQAPLRYRKHLYGIWGSGPDDLYAVGQRGFILHYTP
jgi:photosystem II stability/assembly factor-like uncharacterized protein